MAGDGSTAEKKLNMSLDALIAQDRYASGLPLEDTISRRSASKRRVGFLSCLSLSLTLYKLLGFVLSVYKDWASLNSMALQSHCLGWNALSA